MTGRDQARRGGPASARRHRRGALRRRVGALLATTLLLGVAGAGCGEDPQPAAQTGPPSARPFALSPATPEGTHPFGAHWDWSRYTQFAPYLRTLAGSATYHELTWCQIEPSPGRRDWAAVDRIAQRSRELGITLHLKIRIGVCWATGGTAQHVRGQAGKTESAMPLDLGTYQAFVRAVVTRYSPAGVRRYAIENEVNAAQYWAGTPAEYERLVRVAAQAIRSANPDAQVVDSGISSVAYGMGVVDRLLRTGQDSAALTAYQGYFARRIGTRGRQIPPVADAAALRQVLAEPTNARNLAFLAATERLLDTGTVTVRQVHFYEHPDGVAPFLDYLQAETPAGTPIEAWEVGQFWRDAAGTGSTGAGDDPARTAELVRVVSSLLAGGIRQVIWLPLAYNPNNQAGAEVRYGLLDPDGTQRQAGRAFADLAAVARDATMTPVSDGPLAGVAFDRLGHSALVVWSRSGTPVTVPAAPDLRAGPPGGEPSAPGQPVVIRADPVLLRADRPAAEVLATLR